MQKTLDAQFLYSGYGSFDSPCRIRVFDVPLYNTVRIRPEFDIPTTVVVVTAIGVPGGPPKSVNSAIADIANPVLRMLRARIPAPDVHACAHVAWFIHQPAQPGWPEHLCRVRFTETPEGNLILPKRKISSRDFLERLMRRPLGD